MNDYTQRAAELIESIVKLCDTNYSKLSSEIERDGKPISRQSFFKMCRSGSVKLSVFLELLDVLGLKMEIKK